MRFGKAIYTPGIGVHVSECGDDVGRIRPASSWLRAIVVAHRCNQRWIDHAVTGERLSFEPETTRSLSRYS